MTLPVDFIEIPKSLRTRPRDPRGYPIPYIAIIDKTGKAHFSINDDANVHSCITKRLCGLCGKRLDREMWFIGGPRCFTDPHGAFVDPPMHLDCATYALRVCPFLALKNYNNRIDGKTLDDAATPYGMAIVIDTTMVDTRPDTFGLGMCNSYTLVPNGMGRSYFFVEKWLSLAQFRHGEILQPGS